MKPIALAYDFHETEEAVRGILNALPSLGVHGYMDWSGDTIYITLTKKELTKSYRQKCNTGFFLYWLCCPGNSAKWQNDPGCCACK